MTTKFTKYQFVFVNFIIIITSMCTNLRSRLHDIHNNCNHHRWPKYHISLLCNVLFLVILVISILKCITNLILREALMFSNLSSNALFCMIHPLKKIQELFLCWSTFSVKKICTKINKAWEKLCIPKRRWINVCYQSYIVLVFDTIEYWLN